MDVALHVARDGVVAGLVPDVRELAVPLEHALALLGADRHGLAAPVEVAEQKAAVGEAREHALEVPLQRRPLLQDPIAEVHREDAVHADRVAGLQHVPLEQMNAVLLIGLQHADVVPPAPFQRGPVDVEAHRHVLLPTPHPLARRVARAAKILAEPRRGPAAELLEDAVHKVDLGLHALHRGLVEEVAVGRRGGPRLLGGLLAGPAGGASGAGRLRAAGGGGGGGGFSGRAAGGAASRVGHRRGSS